MSQDWNSYDSAASDHDRLRVPVYFAPPARDLAERMEFGSARSVLDVGAGSGIVAMQALDCPLVVAVDPSLEMTRLARQNGIASVAVATMPGLPFPEETFDRVTAGFVLSHVRSYEAALSDMVRVLRPGGLLGATAWGDLSNPYRDLWDSIVEQFVGRDEAKAAAGMGLPWEDWLARPGSLRDAFTAAGLRRVTADNLEYPIPMTIATFLEMRETSLMARFLRARVDDAGWQRFRETVRAEFHQRFRDPIDHARTAWIVVGRR